MAFSTVKSTTGSMSDLEDAFVNVMFEEDAGTTQSNSTDPFYDSWVDHASAKLVEPTVFAARALRKIYPHGSLVLFTDATINLLGFPGALIQPTSPSELITSLFFAPYARRAGQTPGVLVDTIKFGSFKVAWDKYDFLMYAVKYTQGFSFITQHYLLHDGPEERSRALLVAAGAWMHQLHEEIYVFNNGMWNKDHALWIEVQKANWDDVILKQQFKDALRKDVIGFFSSEDLYKSLAIPWKRGLIMYGPPGNGKTISMKAVMKECDAKGYAPLYVKSFKSWMGEEGSMAAVFSKAREIAPCVVILEDLDSLINDQNRSFFLNQLDGLEGNDGLLVIGSTNHFDKLDPALSGRPSRFDRKYLFDDPDQEERAMYAKYWQSKLRSNDSVSFPDSLVDEIATATVKFSFAYLKEAFVSTLVLLAGLEDEEKPSFASVIRGQIKSLRDQLDKDTERIIPPVHIVTSPGSSSRPCRKYAVPGWRRTEAADSRPAVHGRIWDTGEGNSRLAMPGGLPQREVGETQTKPAVLGGSVLGRSFVF